MVVRYLIAWSTEHPLHVTAFVQLAGWNFAHLDSVRLRLKDMRNEVLTGAGIELLFGLGHVVGQVRHVLALGFALEAPLFIPGLMLGLPPLVCPLVLDSADVKSDSKWAQLLITEIIISGTNRRILCCVKVKDLLAAEQFGGSLSPGQLILTWFGAALGHV